MPKVHVNNIDLFYEDSGAGDETIVFSHGLLWNTRLFDKQVNAFKDRFRCVAYDHRGQGRSDVPKTSVIDMETVYEDAAALIEKLDLAPCHFAGLSMGGFVGLRLAARRPDLLRSLIVLGSSADTQPNRFYFRLLNFLGRMAGPRIAGSQIMTLFFGNRFLNDPARKAERDQYYELLTGNDPSIYRAVNGVVQRKSIYDEIGNIRVPTLIMVGEEDITTVPEKAERMHARIPNSKLVRIPRTGHTINIENPQATNQAIAEFLEQLSAQPQSTR